MPLRPAHQLVATPREQPARPVPPETFQAQLEQWQLEQWQLELPYLEQPGRRALLLPQEHCLLPLLLLLFSDFDN